MVAAAVVAAAVVAAPVAAAAPVVAAAAPVVAAAVAAAAVAAAPVAAAPAAAAVQQFVAGFHGFLERQAATHLSAAGGRSRRRAKARKSCAKGVTRSRLGWLKLGT